MHNVPSFSNFHHDSPFGGPDTSERGNMSAKIVVKEITDGWKYIVKTPEVREIGSCKSAVVFGRRSTDIFSDINRNGGRIW